MPTPAGKRMLPDTAYIYFPPITEDSNKISELESQLKLTKDQIVAAKECIQNDKKQAAEELLKMDEANLKELEAKLVSVTAELKKYEESILETVSTL